jgi:hypothetical protein
VIHRQSPLLQMSRRNWYSTFFDISPHTPASTTNSPFQQITGYPLHTTACIGVPYLKNNPRLEICLNYSSPFLTVVCTYTASYAAHMCPSAISALCVIAAILNAKLPHDDTRLEELVSGARSSVYTNSTATFRRAGSLDLPRAMLSSNSNQYRRGLGYGFL